MAGINEDILKEDNMDSIELENICIDIFRKCDNDHEGNVQVSKLIKFIAPFIQSNDEHLFELNKILDPLNINPVISYDLFSNAMKIWTAKFNNQLHTSFASNEQSVCKKRLSDHDIRQSTPTKERGPHRIDFDCGLNLSNISSYSCAGSVQSAFDPVILNEQINELQYKNKKLSELLNEVRGQLATSEEVNNNLQHDIDKLKKCRQTDQKIGEDLQKMRIELEKEREDNSILKQNHNSVTQSLSFYKKENSQQRKQILEFETEIQKNQEIITSLRHKEDKLKAKTDNYKQELQVKNDEILSLQEKIGELNKVTNEKDAFIKEVSEELQNVRSDNSTLQKNLDDITNKNTSKPDLPKSGKSSVTFRDKFKNSRSSTPNFSPYSRKLFSFDSPILNSPKTLKMLSSPITPFNKTSSFETFSDSSKSTVIEQQIFSSRNKNDFVYTCPRTETDLLNHTSSSIDSETNPEKFANQSLCSESALNDDCFQNKSNIFRRSPSPHESLHAELFKASNSECFGSHTYCEHRSKLSQLEEDNENLQDQIRKYIEEIETVKKYTSELKNVNTKLQNDLSLLTENQNVNYELLELVEKCEMLQKNYEEISLLNVQLKSEVAVITKENKRYSRLKSKIKKLEDEIFEEKNKSEEILTQNKLFQLKINELSSNLQYLEQKKCDLEKQLLEKDSESKNVALENKELKTKINELTCNIKVLEQKLETENNNSKELSLKIESLQQTKEVNEVLKLNIKELFSKIGYLEQTKQELETKLFKELNTVKEIELKNKELTSQIEKCISSEFHSTAEYETKSLKINLSNLSVKKEMLEQAEEHLKQKLSEEECVTRRIKQKMETLEEKNKQLDDKCIKEERITRELKEKLRKEEYYTEELLQKIGILEQKKNQLEEKCVKEESITKELKQKLCKEECFIRELKQNIEILEENLIKAENLTKELKQKIEILEQKKEQLEEKSVKQENVTKELEQNIRILESKKKLLEEKCLKEESFAKELKQKLNEKEYVTKELNQKIEILEQKKKQFEEISTKEGSITKDLKQHIEILEQKKKQLEEKCVKEKSITKELKQKLCKEECFIRELKQNIEILEENLIKGESLTKELKQKIEILKQKKEQLEEKSVKQENVTKELEQNIRILESKKKLLEEKYLKEESFAKELKQKLNEEEYVTKELNQKIEILEQMKKQFEEISTKEGSITEDLKQDIEILEQKKKLLEEKLIKEENFAKELKQKTAILEEKLSKEENTTKEFKIRTEILEKVKYQLEEKLNKEENNIKELNMNISHLSSEIQIVEQTKQDLEEKYYIEENNVKKLKMKVNELTSYVQKLQIFKEEYSREERDRRILNLKLNDLNKILEHIKYQLEEKLSKERNLTKELKFKLNDMCSNVEILEQTKHHLEDQLERLEHKLKSVTALLEELTIKNTELESQNEKNVSKHKKLFMNIENLEKKNQNFRKQIIDLNIMKNELEKNLKANSIQRDSLVSHINFTQVQLKECTDILGKNTLEVTKVWKSDLDLMMDELPVSELVDESSLSGVMRMSVNNPLTEYVKNLKNQSRLTGILLKSLAKLRKYLILEDDEVAEAEWMSAVFSPEFPPRVTQSTFCVNEHSFSICHQNSSQFISCPSMSPECTQSEMTEEETQFSCVELTDVSANSPTGSVFVSNEAEIPVELESLVENRENENATAGVEENGSDFEKKSEKEPIKQYRSMSEGTTLPPLLTDNGDITLFANLQDNVLESLGLQNGEEARDRGSERMSEEEIEEKFQTLALIFAIDAKTLAQRRELQRRQRDQADDNFATEVARLEHGIQRLAPLCVDAETKELITALLTRLNIIVKAAQRISISTQVYGGVHQEHRVAAAVNLMLVHLRNMQQQRDTARRQLQCTKRMLQENTSVVATAVDGTPGVVSVVSRRLSTTSNGRVVTRRRASIATIPRPLDSPSASGPAGIAAAAKRAVRRISADAYSEHSVRPWDSRPRPDWIPLERAPVTARLSRPSRIELGLDLTKIHEGSVESAMNNNEESDSDVTAFETPTAVLPISNLFLEHMSTVREPETFNDHAIDVLSALARFIAYCWNRWMKNGTTREMILFAMFVFIALSSIMMLNIAIMSKFLRQGTVVQRIPWSWLTWDEFWDLFFDVRNMGPRPY